MAPSMMFSRFCARPFLRICMRAGHKFAPSPLRANPEPGQPFRRRDRDEVRQVAPSRQAPFLNPDEPKAMCGPESVLDRRGTDPGERRDVANGERTGPAL